MAKKIEEEWKGTGRRKTSVARVYLRNGSGKITVNKKPLSNFFPIPTCQTTVKEPLSITDTDGRFDIVVNVSGGGVTGQSDAVKMGISRALLQYDPEMRAKLKKAGFLTRDSRMVERKKYGLAGARKRYQYSKR
jgi:small subunit ribosomal protein S9